MLPNKNLIIAIDFDGTIVEDAYPKIGKPMIFAFETMKKLQSEGHRLILWTYRSDRKLQEAVDFCKQQGLEFYAINKSYPEEEFDGKISRKIHATFFVDDRNIGGFIGWTAVHKLLLNYEPEIKKKKGFFSFLK
ncbi:MAG: hydrolase [Flavobacterium sp.]|jgi:hydroxymethylpyrimidine pyrophosphatase-like HAD family hydrolase|nr:hydrolase [Flavobacterium sp.]MBT6377197.1 hydrolase [Flavobacterium sp.]MDB2556054.1 hydrolase [Flavobacteriaceae bacterium]